MNEKERQDYLKEYDEDKKKGLPFFPDILFKDAVVSLLVLVILIALAYFVGAPLEERANPADTSYTPKPEWYFLFLFQLLKYFPGDLEVIGVIVLPTLAILLLLGLPFLDRSRFRHFRDRPVVIAVTALGVIAVVVLSALSILEAPPPQEAALGDPTAALYSENCAGCHGPTIEVPAGTNLHSVIAEGNHEGMPPWSADLTTDEIDALAGFILSPKGNELFVNNCGDCHEAPELVAGDPLGLKNSLEIGSAYPSHAELDIPEWTEVMSQAEITALLNFLIAPDGQRLFAVNCSPCHGQSVAFGGEESDLQAIIAQGGLHLEMPPWRETLSDSELTTLSEYVVSPSDVPEGEALFEQYCESCHGMRIPLVGTLAEAREIIESGGAHETMPVWGEVLTADQLEALVAYSIDAASGSTVQVGQQLFSEYCAVCHGALGEGGPNPARPDDIIAPISTAEYLKTRDDFTLKAIIEQGQPNFGMSPFGVSAGGPLDGEQIDSIVAFLRSWEMDPPVEFPPEVKLSTVSLSGDQIYADLCAQCHGEFGEGLIGPAFDDSDFQASFTDQELFDSINSGHEATAMIAWGEVLTSEQIEDLVGFIRQLRLAASGGPVSFADDVLPILQAECGMCHGAQGGWDASSYEAVMTTGNNAPVVIPGYVEFSLLAQKIQDTQTSGMVMPTAGKMSDANIQVILNWIIEGALDN